MRQLTDGVTQREHLEMGAKKGNRIAIAELEGPCFPEGLRWLWDLYQSLERGRRIGMNGAERFTWTDIKAWCELLDERLQPYEVEALMTVDIIMLAPPKEERAP